MEKEISDEKVITPKSLISNNKATSTLYLPIRIFELLFLTVLHTVFAFLTDVLYMPIKYISPKLFGALMASLRRTCSLLLLGTANVFIPTKLVLTTDESTVDFFEQNELTVSPSKRFKLFNLPKEGIIISNHQGWFDFLYLCSLLYFSDRDKNVILVLFSAAKGYPLLGAIMKSFGFIFMERDWKKDGSNYLDQLSRVKEDVRESWLVMYPEGYLFCKENKEKSDSFARKSGCKPTRYTLLPRVTGIFHAVNILRSKKEYLYDLTLGYEGMRPSDDHYAKHPISDQLIYGNNPGYVHIHVRRYKTSEIPTEINAFTDWIYKVWYEKDELMEFYYKNGVFPAAIKDADLRNKVVGRMMQNLENSLRAGNDYGEGHNDGTEDFSSCEIGGENMRIVKMELPHPLMYLRISLPIVVAWYVVKTLLRIVL